MHWQQKEQNFKRTRPENNSNAVMVRGRQLEELAPALLLPLFSSLTTFLFSTTTTKSLASRNNLQVSLYNDKGGRRLTLTATAPIAANPSLLILYFYSPHASSSVGTTSSLGSNSSSPCSAVVVPAPPSSVSLIVPLVASIIIGPNVSPASVLILATGISLV
jgi:hypothetical protein